MKGKWRHSLFSDFAVIVFNHVGAGVEPSPLLLRPVIGLLYQPWMTGRSDFGAISGMNECGRGNRSSRRKPASSAALSTKYPT
jgi:hypothetical protein